MNMKEKCINETEEDLLRLLKTEIIRLGYADNPNRHSIQKSYDNRNMPNPRSYPKHFGIAWTDILAKIDYQYERTELKWFRYKWADHSDANVL